MNKNNFELVKKSWDIIAKIDFKFVGGAFYIRLFQIAPELRPMFKTSSMTEQSIKLGCMLSYVISNFDNLKDILEEVKDLAERHTKYGVKDEHYKAVGDALMWTLEQGLGEYWNEALDIAWKDLYKTLSAEMMAAQHKSTQLIKIL